MADVDEEFAAFQAELSKLEEAPKAQPVQTAGPRAPKVISAAPSGPQRNIGAEAIAEATAATRVPVAQWSKPEAPPTQQTDAQQAAPAEETATSSFTSKIDANVDAALMRLAQAHAEAEAAGVGRERLGASSSMAVADSRAATLGDAQPPRGPAPPRRPPQGKEKAPAVAKRICAGHVWEDKTLAEWPEDDFRIFVGDLGNETNDDVLGHAFSKYPSFQKARVVRNKQTQKSQGYGFVSFKDPWDMTKALREMHGKYIGNRPVKVRKSTWKERTLQDNEKEWTHALAVNDKREIRKQKNNPMLKKAPHVSKKKKGMPW